MITHATFKPILMNAAARGAVDDVWNSLIYEYPADVAPATLFREKISGNVTVADAFCPPHKISNYFFV